MDKKVKTHGFEVLKKELKNLNYTDIYDFLSHAPENNEHLTPPYTITDDTNTLIKRADKLASDYTDLFSNAVNANEKVHLSRRIASFLSDGNKDNYDKVIVQEQEAELYALVEAAMRLGVPNDDTIRRIATNVERPYFNYEKARSIIYDYLRNKTHANIGGTIHPANLEPTPLELVEDTHLSEVGKDNDSNFFSETPYINNHQYTHSQNLQQPPRRNMEETIPYKPQAPQGAYSHSQQQNKDDAHFIPRPKPFIRDGTDNDAIRRIILHIPEDTGDNRPKWSIILAVLAVSIIVALGAFAVAWVMFF